MNTTILKAIIGRFEGIVFSLISIFNVGLNASKRYNRSVYINHHGYDLQHLTILREGREIIVEGIVPAYGDQGLKCFKEFYTVGKRFKIDPQGINYHNEQLEIPITVYA